jgi:hypothetical protein
MSVGSRHKTRSPFGSGFACFDFCAKLMVEQQLRRMITKKVLLPIVVSSSLSCFVLEPESYDLLQSKSDY